MYKNLKLSIILAIFLVGILLASAETTILKRTGVSVDDSHRQDVLALDDEENLVVNGSFNQDFEIPNGVLRLIMNYVSDKNGHRVKYTFDKKVPQRTQHTLNPFALKSIVA